MWRFMPAVSAALLAMTVGTLAVYTVEGDRSVQASHFGAAGDQWRVIAVVTDDQGARNLTAAVTDFCEEQSASVAFASGDASVVTLFDPTGRFAAPGGSLYSRMEEAGSTPAALVSSAVATGESGGVDLVSAGVRVLGLFEPSAVFDGIYPAIVQNPAVSGFRSGTYKFAGLGTGDEEALSSLFAENGMEIVRWEAEEALTPKRLFSTLFGKAMVGFSALSLLSALLVLWGHGILARPRLTVAARCGATAGDLRRLALARLVPQSLLGLLGGAAVVLGVTGVLRDTMLTGTMPVFQALAVAVSGCCAAYVVLLVLVAWWEARRNARALPR